MVWDPHKPPGAHWDRPWWLHIRKNGYKFEFESHCFVQRQVWVMGFQELCLLCYETQRLRHNQVERVAQSPLRRYYLTMRGKSIFDPGVGQTRGDLRWKARGAHVTILVSNMDET